MPEQRVPWSGIYRVHQDSHRLIQEASLRAGEIFPCCKQCGNKISFELIRRLRDAEELLFGATSFLQKYTESATVSLNIGHFRLLQIVGLLSAVNLKP